MDYIDVIKAFFSTKRNLEDFFEDMYCLVENLKKEGFEYADVNMDIVDAISNEYLGNDIAIQYKNKLAVYTIYYLKFFIGLDYDTQHSDTFQNTVTPTTENQSVDDLKPEDFKKMEIDTEYMELVDSVEFKEEE